MGIEEEFVLVVKNIIEMSFENFKMKLLFLEVVISFRCELEIFYVDGVCENFLLEKIFYF